MLGGGFSGRLNRIIRVQRGLAYYALSGFLPREDEGIAMAFTQTRNEAVPEVVLVMLAEIARLSTEPVAPEELETRRAALVGGFARGLETVDDRGFAVAAIANHGLPIGELERYVSNIRAVSAEDIRKAASTHLDPARFSIIVVGDSSQFLEALRRDYPNVELIQATDLNLDGAALL